MTLRLAISGFGRIGRMTLRAFQEMGHQDMEIVLINSPGPVETSAHLKTSLGHFFQCDSRQLALTKKGPRVSLALIPKNLLETRMETSQV